MSSLVEERRRVAPVDRFTAAEIGVDGTANACGGRTLQMPITAERVDEALHAGA